MEIETLLDGLNDQQRAAVTAPLGHRLVLAGAGSGKTRVLIHRIAWLIAIEKAAPSSILAVTFTNKAAKEMRQRLERVLGGQPNGLWVGTFHGVAHKLLRIHYAKCGLPRDFQLLDSDDQRRLVRRLIKEQQLDDKLWQPKAVVAYINSQKEEGLHPDTALAQQDPITRVYQQLYALYQQACQKTGLVDFADLLLHAYELWLNNPALLAHYQQRFQHILVDEFQDTNRIQYAWIRLLGQQQSHVMIVGDEDQSIYGWRGAQVGHIQQFLEDYPAAEETRLEQNYRSTAMILGAANSVIRYNQHRLGKVLWTEGDQGTPVQLYPATSDYDEARYVVDLICQWRQRGNSLAECAVLYRTNAQSRLIEEALLAKQLPYRIYGGLRFYERQEIKDAMAYLRLTHHVADDTSFERIINTPPRGIGEQSLTQVRQLAQRQNTTLWDAACTGLEQGSFSPRCALSLGGFVNSLREWQRDLQPLPLAERLSYLLTASGLKAMYAAEKADKSETRLDNLKELINAAEEFAYEDNTDPISAFLAHAVLESGEYEAQSHVPAVQLMTLHTAKGLEFPQVFILGMEEGLFPNPRAIDSPQHLEEERRLCYVGMTRAKQQLHLCYAESRRLYGKEIKAKPSRFLAEIAAEFTHPVRTLIGQRKKPAAFASAPSAQVGDYNAKAARLQVGDRVNHPKWGRGTVLGFEGDGERERINLAFHAGNKWLILAYARLERLNN